MLPELSDVQKLRRYLGLTQKELAEISNVSQSSIAKIESKSIDPSYSNGKKILEALEGVRRKGEKVARDVMHSKIIGIRKGAKLSKALNIMRAHELSQLIVTDSHGRIIGNISEKSILAKLELNENFSLERARVSDVMDEAFPTVNEKTPVSTITHLLRDSMAIIVMRSNRAVGIITKMDLLKSV